MDGYYHEMNRSRIIREIDNANDCVSETEPIS